MLDFLYNGADARDQLIFEGLSYVGPTTFSHGDWHTVATISKSPASGDGQDCEIQECRMPARFFRLLVHPTPDSVGEVKAGWILSTGSGDEVGKLLVSIAKQVSQGMLGWNPYSAEE